MLQEMQCLQNMGAATYRGCLNEACKLKYLKYVMSKRKNLKEAVAFSKDVQFERKPRLSENRRRNFVDHEGSEASLVTGSEENRADEFEYKIEELREDAEQ